MYKTFKLNSVPFRFLFLVVTIDYKIALVTADQSIPNNSFNWMVIGSVYKVFKIRYNHSVLLVIVQFSDSWNDFFPDKVKSTLN